MKEDYGPYPDYHQSGIEWIEKIPKDWSEEPFFTQCAQNDSDNKGMVENNLLSLSYGRVIRKNIETADGLLPASFETYQVIEKDYIVFRLTDLQNDKRSLRSAICTERGIITSAYLAVSPTKINSNYFAYLMRSYDHTKVFYALGSGLRQSLKYSDMKRLPLLVPLPSEQKQIAAFLDYETGKIDALIEKQQQLIALLGEKRQAVISHAVTKGLNSDAPMRDSGVEWLGEVPEHWTVCKFGRLAFMQEGPGLRTWQFRTDGTRVICVTNITEDGINFALLQKFISNEEYLGSYTHFTVEKGNLLLSSSGNSWGKVARYNEDEAVILNTSTIRVDELEHQPLTVDFIRVFLQSDACREQLGIMMTGSCQPNFGPTHLNRVKTPSPPVDEQEAISQFIDEQSEKYHGPIRASKAAIELLQERRIALISAAVTGKIDVRGWKPPSSDVATEKDVA